MNSSTATSVTNSAIEILRGIARRAGQSRLTLTLSTFDLDEIRACVLQASGATTNVNAVDPVPVIGQGGLRAPKDRP